jgi:ribosomal protein S12 methylthiotransferase
MLPELLHRLCRIEDLKWIRLLYCYPEEITPELLTVMRDEKKICHYLDLPIQHSEDHILRRMGRKTSRADLEEKIRMIRAYLPDVALRTTLITGFPGETEEEHEALKEFISGIRFDRLGVFPYSQEEDTPAAAFPDQIPEEIKQERYDELMSLQQEIAFEKAREMAGSCVQVIIEGYIPEDGVYVGRTYRDAPNVDGYVFVSYAGSLMSGDVVDVMITSAQGYDLIGEAIYESAE